MTWLCRQGVSWDGKRLTGLSARVLGGDLRSGLPLCDLYDRSWKEWGRAFRCDGVKGPPGAASPQWCLRTKKIRR